MTKPALPTRAPSFKQLLAALCLLLLSGLAVAQDPVEISVAYWGSNEEAATMELMLKAFEEENPDIKVERIWVQQDYEQKVLTMIAGGTAPDLIQMSHTSLPGFARTLAPVELDADAYTSPTFVEALSYDGTQLVVPFVVKPKVMGINADLFEAKGIPLPSADEAMTPEEFRELAFQLTSGEGQSKVYGSAPLWFTGWMSAFGGSFYNDDATLLTTDSPEVIEAAQFVIDSYTKDPYAPTPDEATGQSMFDWFLGGKVAMYPDFGPWFLPMVKQAENINWQLVPVPGEGEPTEITGLGISSSSANPEEAQALALFISQSEVSQNILATSDAAVGVPVIPAAVDAFAETVPGKNLVAFINAATSAPVPVGSPKDTQIFSEFYRELEARTALGTGSEDPAVVLPEITANLNQQFMQ